MSSTDWGSLVAWLTRPLFEIGGIAVTASGIFRLVLILVAAWWISKLAQAALGRIAERRPNFNSASLYALNRLLHYAVLTLGFAVALSSLGLDLDKFALFASALGVGVGFSSRKR
jgi:small-conductance mechanosensitive channel